jgi:hypothetical protein
LVGKANPKAIKGVSIQKVMNYHPLDETRESFDVYDPENSTAYTSRVEMSNLSKDIGTIVDPS